MAEVASAAGEKWRSLSEEEKKGYEEASAKAKVQSHPVLLTCGRASAPSHVLLHTALNMVVAMTNQARLCTDCQFITA